METKNNQIVLFTTTLPGLFRQIPGPLDDQYNNLKQFFPVIIKGDSRKSRPFFPECRLPDYPGSSNDLSGVRYSAALSGIVGVTTVPPPSLDAITRLPPHMISGLCRQESFP